MGVLNTYSAGFYMEVVSEESASIFSSFSCGNEVIDKYFREKTESDSAVCYVYRNAENQDIVCAAAICCSGINMGNDRSQQLMPAVKIDYFAISEKYQDVPFPGTDIEEHFYISDAFLCELVKEIGKIAESYVGAEYIVLYSVPDAVHFYQRNHFLEFEKFMTPEHRTFLDGCTPMYMAFS